MGSFVNDLIKEITMRIGTDRQKIQAIKRQTNENDKVIIAKTLSSDELKLQVIGQLTNDMWKVDLLKCIKQNYMKIKAIKNIGEDNYRLDNSVFVELFKTDQDKMYAITNLDNILHKVELGKKINLDEIKMLAIDMFEDDIYKTEIIETMTSDEMKLQAMKKIKNEKYVVDIAETMTSDEIKLQAMDKLKDEYTKKNLAKTISSDEMKLQVMDKFEDNTYKTDIAKTISSDEMKLQAMKKIKDETYCVDIAKTISSDEMKLQAMDELKDNSYKVQIVKTIKSDEILLQALYKFGDKAGSLFDKDFIIKHINVFKQMENPDITLDIDNESFKRMYDMNNSIIHNVDARILDKKYIDQLGEDKINLITCYPDIQSKVLSLNDKELLIFSKCINNYLESNETEEWQVLADEILDHMAEYDELIKNIEHPENLETQSIEKLSRILQTSNWCNITNIEEVNRYDDIVKEKCNEVIQNDDSTIEQKRQAVVQKIFGHDLQYAQNILSKFGVDNENLNECEMKDYVRCLQEILKTENPEVLREIFDKCEFVECNKIALEKNLKQEYCKKYIETLYVPKEEDLEPDKTNVYNAGTDFRIMIHAVSAYGSKKYSNYKDDWNRPEIGTQQVCTSYIRNDMLGRVSNHLIYYGFSNISPDALMVAGPEDVYSQMQGSFVVKAERGEQYYTPDEQINHTGEGKFTYNEMDFRRVQNGKKMQPDYIIVFKKDGVIPDMAEAEKASADWGGMPIVVIDEDACLAAQKQKTDELLLEYQQNPSQELEHEIMQKVRNNRVANDTFYLELEGNLQKIKAKNGEKSIPEKTMVEMDELKENYAGVSANEREEEKKKIREVYGKIQEAVRGVENIDERQ